MSFSCVILLFHLFSVGSLEERLSMRVLGFIGCHLKLSNTSMMVLYLPVDISQKCSDNT